MSSHLPRGHFEQLEERSLLAIDFGPLVQAAAAPSSLAADGPAGTTITPIATISDVDTNATLKNPQSKVWSHDGVWWSVLNTNSGTSLYRLDGATWTQIIFLTGSFHNADVLPVGNGDVTYALLYSGGLPKLAKFTYVSGAYELTPLVSPAVPLASVPISAGSDTATIAIDTTGKMWLAYDAQDTIEVRYADAPYTSWSAPVTLATTSSDERELSAIVAFDGKIGVLWSNHLTQRFGFRYHVDGADPTDFSVDEVPASQSALNAGSGMADDHMNIKVGADGTLYAAVKTAYDLQNITYPEIALLVRRPNGAWDPLYKIAAQGTRPIVEINDAAQFIRFIYAGDTGVDDIVYKDIPFAEIDPTNPDKFYSGQDVPSSLFPRQTLIAGGLSKHVASTVQSFNGELVVVATNASASPEAGRTP